MPQTYLSREDPAIVAILPDQFYMASKRCLELADWMIRPQFRILQSCVIVVVFFNTSQSIDTKSYFSLQSVCDSSLRMVQCQPKRRPRLTSFSNEDRTSSKPRQSRRRPNNNATLGRSSFSYWTIRA